jgi:hypothetical protein
LVDVETAEGECAAADRTWIRHARPTLHIREGVLQFEECRPGNRTDGIRRIMRGEYAYIRQSK